jgi:alkylhydroperoxidase family enzyme
LNRVVQGDACQPITDAALSDIERWVVQYAAQMTRNVKVDDALFAAIQARFTTTELVELTAAIATYNMVARFLVALQITPDGEAPR